MMQTRTGSFPIGVRRGWSDWQKNLGNLLDWCKASGLGVVDLGADAEAARTAAAAGLKVGSVDLVDSRGLLSPDKARRTEVAAKNAAHVEACTKAGVRNFFAVMVPEKPELKRAENFAFMLDGLGQLVPALEKHGGRLVIEGWPGPGALCCTPEGYRALFKDIPSKALGINYDPSHLVRMNIDHVRFAEEFAARIYHVHGKDTEILTENLYEYGTEQPPTFGKALGFGGMTWRYTIPGQGVVRWHRVFWILKQAGYTGAVSIELEDAHFNGTEEGEKRGILAAARFLEGA